MNMHEFIFSKKRSQQINRHVIFWIGFYVFTIIVYPPAGSGIGIYSMNVVTFYEMICIRCIVHTICQMLFVYPLMYLLMPAFFWKKKYIHFITCVLLLWIITAGFRYVIFMYAYNPIMKHLGMYVNPAPFVLFISVTQVVEGPAFMGFTFIAVKFFKDMRQKEQDNFNLKKENADAELNLLKAQVHPHFLFNTLNNIYSFTLNKSPKAKELVYNLHSIMQYMVNDCNVEQIELSKDLKMINDYIELEKVRYGNRLDIAVNIEGDYQNKMVTPLLMIPFVENSFKHGTSKMLAEPWIKLFIQADENILHFTLVNSKPPVDNPKPGKGIGLNNVKKRLELLYPQHHLLTIEFTDNTFTVSMQIPIYKVEEKIVA